LGNENGGRIQIVIIGHERWRCGHGIGIRLLTENHIDGSGES
jgi:hypothetical protein